MQLITDFFTDIDARWPSEPTGKVRLPIIGCGALMLQANYERGTKDSDVFETVDLTGAVKRNLVAIAGPGTDLHKRWKLYVDIVANGVPFLPHAPLWHPVPGLNQALVRLEIVVLDVVDVVVSKLKRFHANDQADIDAMVERGLVPHERLIDRFRAAVDEFSGDARADQLSRYATNLHRVERDMLGVAESEIDLPSWI
jgi:uncharacterized nucleotidyltransferase DUF6036